MLSSLFASAYHVGRDLRRTFAADRWNGSVSSLALEFAIERLGRLPRRILLIGTGKTARLAASRLGSAEILVVSGRKDAAVPFPGARAISPEELKPMRWEGDLVIAATNRPGYALEQGDIPDTGETVLMDLAFPRNIDPGFRTSRCLRLYDLDDLAIYARSAPKPTDLENREAAVRAEAEKFTRRLLASRLSPALPNIYRWAESLRKEEVERAMRMMPEAEEDERRVVEEMTRSLVGRLLAPHASFARREGDGASPEERLRLLESIFGEGGE